MRSAEQKMLNAVQYHLPGHRAGTRQPSPVSVQRQRQLRGGVQGGRAQGRGPIPCR